MRHGANVTHCHLWKWQTCKVSSGECLPCAMQLGSMGNCLLTSLPFPSTFKISIATWVLTAKPRRDFLCWLCVKWMFWLERKTNCLNWRICQILCWCCVIKTTYFDSSLHTPALQEAPGRKIPPSWIDLWLLELVTVVLAAGLLHPKYHFVLFLTAPCHCSSSTVSPEQASPSRVCPSGLGLVQQLQPDLLVCGSSLRPPKSKPRGLSAKLLLHSNSPHDLH